MAKNISFIICFLFAPIFVGNVHAYTLKQNQVRNTYLKELGVRENGFNKGQRVEEYLRAANLKAGNAWCAAFVTWTFKQVGIKAVVSGYSPNWFVNNVVYKRDDNVKRNYVTTVGDVFGLWFANKNRIAHVGFIDSRQGDYYITVEGNTNEAGSREGDGVYKKRRHIKTIYAISRWIK
jgi:hypothetical protein